MPAGPDRWRADISSQGEVFVAASARLRGKIVFAGENGVWYGCDLDAGVHVIEVGRNTNIQDNSVIRAIAGPVVVGPDCTIGHNVMMSGLPDRPREPDRHRRDRRAWNDRQGRRPSCRRRAH
jgi:carbonic anhydrase/acetyltransferase-like protein (isoleucine patch superfamily)